MRQIGPVVAACTFFALLIIGCAGEQWQDSPSPLGATAQYNNKSIIQDFYPDKASYRGGEVVKLIVETENKTAEPFNGHITISIKKYADILEEKTIGLDYLASGEKKVLLLDWYPPAEEYQGYMVSAAAVKGGKIVDSRNTALDVSPDWKKFPRYGYLSNYGGMTDEAIGQVVERLSRHHINGLQFYDWQDSHDAPLAGSVENPAAEWQDIAGTKVTASAIKIYIEKCREKNINSVSYNLMFGAYEALKNQHPEWGLYKDRGRRRQDMHQLPASWESSLYLMNPLNSEWQNYLLKKEKEAFAVYPFDTFHVDTLGNRGSLYDYDGNKVELQDTYFDFLTKAKQVLNMRIVGNPVNGYGAEAFAKADTDFLYTEIWPDQYRRYEDIRRIIKINSAFSSYGKSMVLAAYMNYPLKGNFNPHAVKLADAVIFASGASHLELGDTGMLGNEYFPNQDKKMTEELADDMRVWYDFLTAYENLLYRGREQESFQGKLEDFPFSSDPEAGKVWVTGTEQDGYALIHLVNLLSGTDSQWRDDRGTCPAPAAIENFTLSVNINTVSAVYLASPDIQGGNMIPLEYRYKNSLLNVKIPKLLYWNMIVIKL